MKVLLYLLLLLSAKAFSEPDYIHYHGKVFTSEKKNLWVDAIAITGERIFSYWKKCGNTAGNAE